jgi:hypothetical protein
MMGYMYPQIMDVQKGYITCIVASGSGNTSRTGKSLVTSMMQILFDGDKTKERPITITEAALFEKLEKGTPIYSKTFFPNVTVTSVATPYNRLEAELQCFPESRILNFFVSEMENT